MTPDPSTTEQPLGHAANSGVARESTSASNGNRVGMSSTRTLAAGNSFPEATPELGRRIKLAIAKTLAGKLWQNGIAENSSPFDSEPFSSQSFTAPTLPTRLLKPGKSRSLPGLLSPIGTLTKTLRRVL